mmetsp:Transcript_120918/g.349358  ORF Transcript_120918/g.349358 Transcript_120918/m.349358 type:complete len:290 (-) Transcript_120918:130-999(-)
MSASSSQSRRAMETFDSSSTLGAMSMLTIGDLHLLPITIKDPARLKSLYVGQPNAHAADRSEKPASLSTGDAEPHGWGAATSSGGASVSSALWRSFRGPARCHDLLLSFLGWPSLGAASEVTEAFRSRKSLSFVASNHKSDFFFSCKNLRTSTRKSWVTRSRSSSVYSNSLAPQTPSLKGNRCNQMVRRIFLFAGVSATALPRSSHSWLNRNAKNMKTMLYNTVVLYNVFTIGSASSSELPSLSGAVREDSPPRKPASNGPKPHNGEVMKAESNVSTANMSRHTRKKHR